MSGTTDDPRISLGEFLIALAVNPDLQLKIHELSASAGDEALLEFLAGDELRNFLPQLQGTAIPGLASPDAQAVVRARKSESDRLAFAQYLTELTSTDDEDARHRSKEFWWPNVK